MLQKKIPFLLHFLPETFVINSVGSRDTYNKSRGGNTMIQKVSTKLQVQLTQVGSKELKRVNFSNVVDEPTEEEMLILGDVMKALGQNESALDGVLMTVQSKVTK
ncbi:hypothetical protein ID741_001440 [Enterococcus sp. AZ103]